MASTGDYTAVTTGRKNRLAVATVYHTAEIDKELLRKVADSCNLIPTNPRALTHDEVYDILCECL